MAGYIVIPSENWYRCIKEQDISKAVFWRKRLQFKALQEGEPFYFLSRNIEDGERYIVGKANCKDFETLTAKETWNKYSKELGASTEMELQKSIVEIYKNLDEKIWCIVLKDVMFVDEPVLLKNTKVYFPNGIVSGEKIDEDECLFINKLLEKGESNG